MSDFKAEERAALIEGWLAQKTEWSKSIFTIASAAIGLIVTGLLGPGIEGKLSDLTLTMLLASAVSFSVSALSCISAFTHSGDAIEALLTGSQDRTADANLGRLKGAQHNFFVWGLGLLLVAAFFGVTSDQKDGSIRQRAQTQRDEQPAQGQRRVAAPPATGASGQAKTPTP